MSLQTPYKGGTTTKGGGHGSIQFLYVPSAWDTVFMASQPPKFLNFIMIKHL